MLRDMIRNQSQSSYESKAEKDIYRFTNRAGMKIIRDRNENTQTKSENKFKEISGTDFPEQRRIKMPNL